MRMHRSILLLTLVCAAANLTGEKSVRAQQKAEVSCDNDPDCSRIAAQASQQSRAGQYKEARRLYEAAYALRSDPLLLYNLARVLHKSGHPAEAVDYYQRYLDAGAEGVEENHHKSTQLMEQARIEAGQQAAHPVPLEAGQQAMHSVPLAVTPVKPTEQVVPLYKKWWLWTTVGIAAVGLGVGLGSGLAARRPDLTGASEVSPFE